MEGLLNSVIYVLIIGGMAGYFIGYLVKKITHFAAIVGVFAFLLMYMAYTQAISLNLDQLGATIKKFADALAPLGLTTLASSAPFVGSFVIGLIFGFKRAN